MTTSTDTWLDSGSAFCDVPGCYHLADLIADTWDRERFCTNHTHSDTQAGSGWYRITDIRNHPLGLLLTVQAL